MFTQALKPAVDLEEGKHSPDGAAIQFFYARGTLKINFRFEGTTRKIIPLGVIRKMPFILVVIGKNSPSPLRSANGIISVMVLALPSTDEPKTIRDHQIESSISHSLRNFV